MKKIKSIPLLALMLVCMGAFLFPVSARAQGNVAPPFVTAYIIGDNLRIETSAGYYGVEAVFIDEKRINYRVDSVLDVYASDYFDDSDETVSIYAVDFAGNKSNVVMLENPYFKKPEVPLQASPFTPDGQASVVDQANESEGKNFYTFTTPEGNVFHLVIDHQRNQDNVYFLNAITETDLFALTEKSSGSTAIPTPTPPPVADNPTETEEPAEPVEPEREKGNGTIIFIIIAALAVGGAGYYFKIVKPKQQAPDISDEEDEDDGEEMQFEDEPEEDETGEGIDEDE